ncbi:MAG: 2-oxoacid:ferredoxin oxidoreductase subunit gamma [Planctomycetes bacterium]|nr:2-oxoacid:ferredoxin oxidoreductase subunit gamma [Planctomycetota bacterium]MBM4081233.1 2-oxoacid:ferredoxin oxidoreductase subunit gamma [Planctomycetota bacterium]MBM4083899.1 2-oxoacid:ferredoxin oxidoreductase subunit gamma [Planctomycetota bacterium]
MTEKVIMAGFGGQGMMLLGKLVAHAMMTEGKQVTFFPSYGSEVRGGTAHCHVIIAEDEIASPVVEEADTLIVMNQPSYEKFKRVLKPGGLLLVNASMVKVDDAPKEAQVVRVPATEAANGLGNVLVANMVMMGAYNRLRRLMPTDRFLGILERSMSGRKAALLEINKRALAAGEALAAEASAQSKPVA